MPKVPSEFVPTIDANIAPAPSFQQANVHPAGGGAIVGKPVDLSSGVSEISKLMSNISRKIQDDADEAETKFALVEATKQSQQIASAFSKNKMNDVHAHYQKTIEDLDSVTKRISEGMKSDQARKMFDRAWSYYALTPRKAVEEHFSAESEKYINASSEAYISNLSEIASIHVSSFRDQGGDFNKFRDASTAELIKLLARHGIPENSEIAAEKIRSHNTSIAKKSVDELIYQKKFGDALEFIANETMRGTFNTNDAANITKSIEAERDRVMVPEIVDSLLKYGVARTESGSAGAFSPVKAPSRVTSTFGDVDGRKHPHQGIDYAVPSGTPVVAPVDGMILDSGEEPVGGKWIRLKTGSGDVVTMRHLSKNNVLDAGVLVGKGEMIALSGNTGTSTTGPHVHMEWERDGKKIDPMIVNIPDGQSSPVSLRDKVGLIKRIEESGYSNQVKQNAISLLNSKLNIQEALHNGDQVSRIEEAVDLISKGVPISSLPSSLWTGIDDKGRESINKMVRNKKAEGSAFIENEFMSGRIPFTRDNLAKHAGEMSPEVYKRFLGQIMEPHNNINYDKDRFSNILIQSGLGKIANPSRKNEEEQKAALKFRVSFEDLLREEANKKPGYKPTVEDQEKILNKMILDVAVIPGWFTDDVKSVFVMSEKEREKAVIPDGSGEEIPLLGLPKDVMAAIMARLKKEKEKDPTVIDSTAGVAMAWNALKRPKTMEEYKAALIPPTKAGK